MIQPEAPASSERRPGQVTLFWTLPRRLAGALVRRAGIDTLTSSQARRWLGWILPALLLCAWVIAALAGKISPLLMPGAVLKTAWEMVIDGSLLTHCLISGKRLMLGFLIGSSVGVIVGAMIGVSVVAEGILEPSLSVLAPVPPIVWVPLLIIVLGIDDASKIGLVALGSLFVVILNTVQGIRSTDQRLDELAAVYGKSSLERLLQIYLPAALPQIFTGLRTGMALSWTLLLLAEIIASSAGLGWLVWNARNFGWYDNLVVATVTIGLLGRASDLALASIERCATKWHTTIAGQGRNG